MSSAQNNWEAGHYVPGTYIFVEETVRHVTTSSPHLNSTDCCKSVFMIMVYRA